MKTTRMQAALVLLLLALAGLPGQVGAQWAGQGEAASPAVPRVAGEWPMYGHDPSRTNYNPNETVINAGNVAQLVSRWQFNIGSNGTATSSTPSIAGGRVYVGSSVASGNNFFAVDALSGVQAWAANLGYFNTCFNVGIGATPAISGSIVVAGGGDQPTAHYFGLDTNNNGAVLWQNLLAAGNSAFPWASPLIYGSNTFVGVSSRCDNPSVRGEVRGLNVATGVPYGSQYFVNSGQAGGGIWNSPALSPDGATLVAVTGEDYTCNPCTYTRSIITMDATNPALPITGQDREGTDNTDQDWGSTPIIFHDSQNRVLVGSHLKSVNGGATPYFYAYLLNNVNAGPIWQRNTSLSTGMMDAYDPTFNTGGTLFIMGSGGNLYAVDPATGLNISNAQWPTNPISVGGTAHNNMAIANGLIFINLGATGVRVINESTGAILRTLVPANAGSANSGIAVANGFIYWLSGSYLNAWSIPATTPTPGPSATPVPSSTPVPPSATRTGTAIAPSSTPVPPSVTFVPLTNTPGAATSTPPGPSTTPVLPTGTTIPPTGTPTAPAATATPPAGTVTPCAVTFNDVPVGNPFYPFIRCLVCRGIVSGYGDGTFRPNNTITRGQISKMISNAARLSSAIPSDQQTFEDVPPASPFWYFVEQLVAPGYISGYSCGGPGEPCVPPANRPYFRPYANITRGQIAKIDANAAGWSETVAPVQTFEDVPTSNPFWLFVERINIHGVISGYGCGGVGEPCQPPGNRPYFRPYASATRGQAAKIVANTFYPNCQTP